MPDPHVHFVSLVSTVLGEEDDETEKFNYTISVL